MGLVKGQGDGHLTKELDEQNGKELVLTDVRRVLLRVIGTAEGSRGAIREIESDLRAIISKHGRPE